MTMIRLVEERQSSLLATSDWVGVSRQATMCERRSESVCERRAPGSEYVQLGALVFEVLCSKRPLGL
jgi:hypothetical protein